MEFDHKIKMKIQPIRGKIKNVTVPKRQSLLVMFRLVHRCALVDSTLTAVVDFPRLCHDIK